MEGVTAYGEDQKIMRQGGQGVNSGCSEIDSPHKILYYVADPPLTSGYVLSESPFKAAANVPLRTLRADNERRAEICK